MKMIWKSHDVVLVDTELINDKTTECYASFLARTYFAKTKIHFLNKPKYMAFIHTWDLMPSNIFRLIYSIWL